MLGCLPLRPNAHADLVAPPDAMWRPETHLRRHLIQLGAVEVEAADHVALMLQQAQRVARAEIDVVQEDHAVRRPHGLAAGAPAGQAPRRQLPIRDLHMITLYQYAHDGTISI